MVTEQNKKREFPNIHLQHHQQPPKRTSFHSGFGAQAFPPESLGYIETFLRALVREEVERKFEAHLNLPPSSSRSSGSEEVGAIGSGGTVELNLYFVNKIPSVIFTSNDIKAENGEAVEIALAGDPTNSNNIVETGLLSSALIELVVLDGEFGSGHGERSVDWSASDFNKSIVIQRAGERPLLTGNDKRIRLVKGVARIADCAFTTNSSRTRTKNVRLGARIVDEENSVNNSYPRIREGVSNPFRVKDQRGQANKKHHPPFGNDEVWRLEGIAKYGEYHKRLSSEGIQSVKSFVKAYERDSGSLRKLLGNKLSDKNWMAMVNHAWEYVDPITTFEKNLVEKEEGLMGLDEFSSFNQNTAPSFDYGDGFSDTQIQDQHCNIALEDYAPLWWHGEASTSNCHNHEVENTNTFNPYFQRPCNKLLAKPK